MLAAVVTTGMSGSRTAQVGRTAFSPERLARLDRVLQEYIDDDRVAGIVALVLRDGEAVYERALGWADKETRRPMQIDTIFRVASQTKAVTSAAALVLMDDGKLHPADPVSRYIPAFDRTTVAVVGPDGPKVVPARRQITIRDLLTHTSGISYGVNRAIADRYATASLGPAAGFGWYVADKNEPICATMDRLATLPFMAQPGEAWVYGYSLDVLGCVIERAAGMPLDEVFRTRLFEPLKMRDTGFFADPGQSDRLATVYTLGDRGRLLRAPEGARGQGHYVHGPRRSFGGGAGLLSTIRDYARFLEMIRQEGELDGIRVMSRQSVSLMRTNQVGTLHSRNGLGFGYGFETTERFGATGLACVGSHGWGGAYGTSYLIDPESRLTLLMMRQVVPQQGDLAQRFRTLVYHALGERPSDRCLGNSTH